MTPRRSLTGFQHLPPYLFDESGGIQISGDSGTGKSTLIDLLTERLARNGFGFTLLDPHRDLVQLVKHRCLNMGESVARRVIEIAPGDTSIITRMNPLHVDPTGLDAFTWRARITEKCGHMARIFLHAFGERDFNSKPVLYKWLNAILLNAALLKLSIRDMKHFLAVGSPIYKALTRQVPDSLHRIEFAELEQMRPVDREEYIGSTKNRILGFLSGPPVDYALSCADARALQPRRLIQDNAIILIDLSRHSVLREEDQEIFANLWLMEIVHAIMNTPLQERVPHWIFVDELPVFRSSASLITDCLRQTRKFLLRWVCAHQGTNFFEDRTLDRLLHALVGQCGIHFFFRHIDPVDAKFFAEILGLPTFDPRRVKHTLRQKQQYQAGNELVILHDRSDSSTEGEEEGETTTTGTTNTEGQNESQTASHTHTSGETGSDGHLAKTISDARASASQTGSSSSKATSDQVGTSRSRSRTRGLTRTHRQTLVPILRWRDIVSSVQFFTADEQTGVLARQVATLPTGAAFVYHAGQPPAVVRFPWHPDPFAMTPKARAKKVQAFRNLLLRRDEFALPTTVEAEILAFESAWLAQLQDLPASPAAPPPKRATAGPKGMDPRRRPSPSSDGESPVSI